MAGPTRARERNTREYDTTSLHEGGHGLTLHRDYLAHAFRWAFAKRFITAEDNVLEIGCGSEIPLARILTGGIAPHVKHYTGVDLNKLKPSNAQRLTLHSEFNFVERWKELVRGDNANGFDVVVHLECIEHMHVRHGQAMLKACFACLRPGGTMLMSTPVYDGVHHAANHVNEMTIEELNALTVKAGFVVECRFGTFCDIRDIGREEVRSTIGKTSPFLGEAVCEVYDALSGYFSTDMLSVFFAPLMPDSARNNLWVCRKPSK
jgi:2-polyprenyl-3-methyl-5-hydroxy-6-metoxy-1,4-benzoquinol methylase